MFVIIGWVIVLVSVFGGYMAMGGKLGPLWQPFELVIIGGAGVGAYRCQSKICAWSIWASVQGRDERP